MNRLYLECYSGISGDMLVAALLDLGVDPKELIRILDTVPVDGFQIQISRVKKAGLDVCDFHVLLDQEHENHDHDMKYLYGSEEHHGHEHQEHEHHGHEHGEHEHCEHIHHEHRGFREVMDIIDQTDLSNRARETARKIFTVLGEAEAKAHGTTLDQVHFHEVGAVDSIVDIIAAAVCLDLLDITEVIIPVLYEGCGQIRCQHGILPVPVPAVANIVQRYHLPVHTTERMGELVTPTGAAIAAAIRTSGKLPEQYVVQRIGMGAGKRSYEIPSILRGMLIETEENVGEKDVVWKLESNIDDSSGECLGYVMEQLIQAGARDVSFTPLYMKKNRPACQLNILCDKEKIADMEEIVFRETTTIGIRRVCMERTILKREVQDIMTSWGKACVKVCRDGKQKQIYPEYESVAEISRKTGKPFQEIYRMIQEESNGQV